MATIDPEVFDRLRAIIDLWPKRLAELRAIDLTDRRNRLLRRVAERRGATPAQVAIAWTLRAPGVVSIPKAANAAHVRENAAAAELLLDEADLAEIEAAYAPPRRKLALQML